MTKLITLMLLLSLQSCLDAEKSSRPILTPVTDITSELNNGSGGAILSQTFRTRGAEQLTYSAQTQNLIRQTKDGQHLIPLPEIHNEALIPRPTTAQNDCGVDKELSGVKSRISDCLEKNGATATLWNGRDNGISGEGNFSLIQKSGDKLTWLDDTTGMAWSSRLNEDQSWETAAGINSNIDDEDYLCGSLRNIPNTEIVFRLPTRNDYLIADVNGARHVFSEIEDTFWTATSVDGSTQAWSMNLSSGASVKSSIDETFAVRCIGHVIKIE